MLVNTWLIKIFGFEKEVCDWFRISYDWELFDLCGSLSVVSESKLVCTWLGRGGGECT
jgi:hypothetical protein